MPTFAFISLGAPLMLLGIGAIALPIAAHLMSRRTRRRIVFPTIRLLMESRAAQSSLYRVRRWILLLLRCLALIMVATAFAMPSCSPRHALDPADGNGKAGAAVVFLIDVSASMDRDPRTTGSASLLHTMRAGAQRTLASLTPGVDRVNVIFAQGQPRPLFQTQAGRPMLSANHAAAHEGLSDFELTAQRADLRAALAMAGDMLREAGAGVQRRLVIFSDMQRSNWSDIASATGESSPLPPGTVVSIMPAAIEDASNLALSDARSEPAMPIIHQQTLLIAKVTNHSNAARDVTVAAQLDGQPIGTRTVALAVRESREVSFEAVITTQGRHRIEFSLPDDALPADNRLYLSVEAAQRVSVLVVGDDDASALGSASYFIARALSPRGDRGDLIEVRQLTSLDLAEADLSGAQAVVISRVNRLSDQAGATLVEYLHRGGGVLMFSESPHVPANLELLEAASNAFIKRESGAAASPGYSAPPPPPGQPIRITPWRAAQLRDFTAGPQVPRITEGLWHSPVLTEFDEQARRTLSQIRFHRIWSVEDVNPLATVLLRFGEGTPAAALISAGDGRLIVANFSPSLEAGDLGKYGSFVALSHSLLRYVRPRLDRRGMATVGQAIHASVPIPVGEQAGGFVIEGPQGGLLTPELSRIGSRMSVMLPRTEAAGFYRVLRNDQPVGDVAVNLDPRESDLRALDEDAVASLLKSTGVTIDVLAPATAGDALELRGQPLWHWFVVAAMVFMAMELALLSVWSR